MSLSEALDPKIHLIMCSTTYSWTVSRLMSNCDRACRAHVTREPVNCRYVRLELLEGVAAYYSGNKALAQAKLKSSEQRWQQLQVSDERLAELMSMGFKSQEVRLWLGSKLSVLIRIEATCFFAQSDLPQHRVSAAQSAVVGSHGMLIRISRLWQCAGETQPEVLPGQR